VSGIRRVTLGEAVRRRFFQKDTNQRLEKVSSAETSNL